MTVSAYFPAYASLASEPGLSETAWRVYMHLLPARLDFSEPRDVKAWALAMELELSANAVSRALTWLVDRGYLIAVARNARGVRSFRLAYALAGRQTASQ